MINNTRPIGLEALCTYVDDICANALLYKHTGKKPKPIIVNLSKGQGQTRALEFIADMFKEYQVLGFESGTEDFIEIDFDGTYDNYIECIEKIESAKIYHNFYDDGVIGINAIELSKHKTEKQWKEFLIYIKTLCKMSYVVFFVPNYECVDYLNSIKDCAVGIKEIVLSPYTEMDYSNIILSQFKEEGIEIDDDKKAVKAIYNIVISEKVNSVPDAERIAWSLFDEAVAIKKNGAVLISNKILNAKKTEKGEKKDAQK